MSAEIDGPARTTVSPREGCEWHEQQTGGASPNRDPGGREPDTDEARARLAGKPARQAVAVPHLHREGGRVEAIGARWDPNASEAPRGVHVGQAVPQQRPPIFRWWHGRTGDGTSRSLLTLTHEICRVPRER